MTNNKLEQLKSVKLLQLWGQLPNPDYAFLTKGGRSHHKVLSELTYTAEIQSSILARESAVMGDPWEIVCDNHSVDFIIENFNRLGMNSIFRNIFHGIWYGYTVLEHPMEKIDGKWVYTKINSLPSDWFSFNGQGGLVPSQHLDTSPMNTMIGDIEKEVELVQYRETLINPYGEGLLARVFWFATWIRGGLDLWISYLDRFGDDAVIGKMDVSNDEKRMQLLHAIAEFKSSGAIVLEGTDTLETIQTDKANSSALFKDFHTLCKEEINKLILGHASALEGQAGKLGNDESLSIVRQDITQGDKMLIEEVINRMIKHLCLVNGIKDDVRFFFTPEKEDEKAKIERDQKIVAMGFELSEEYMRTAYRFSENDLKKAPTSPVPSFSEDIENRKKGDSGRLSVEDYYKTIDELIEKRKEDNSFSKLQNKIFSAIEKVEFFEDGVSAILQEGNAFKIDSDNFALKLLNAHIIGQNQIIDKISSLSNVSFSERGERLFDTFDEAREYYEARFNLPATHFYQLSEEMKKYAFTVSSIVREDILADISQGLLESYDKGESFYKFKKSLREGKFQKELEELTDRKLELIYTQNMNSAYSYGRYQGLMQAVDIFPNWEYITIGDGRVRSSHRALQGIIRRYDDPFWQSHYPPNGYRCRCVVEVSTEEPNGKGIPKWDKIAVDKAFENGIYPKNFQLGKEIGVSHGFDHNVGEMNGWVKDRISQIASTLSKIPTRTSFFSDSKPLQTWDKNKDVLSAGTDYSKAEKGLELAKNRLKGDIGVFEVVFDKNGNMVGSDFDYIISHISTIEKKGKRIFDQAKWNSRAELVDKIKEIIETGEIVEDIERYGKNKKLILSRKYIKNVKLNGENTPVMIIAEYAKNEKDSIPILTTIYTIGDLETRTGILLK